MVSSRIAIRPFDGSLADAQGLMAVERAVFDESPYDARQVRTLLADSSQRAWLATVGKAVAGFVMAFPTTSLKGLTWEIDLLAVHPDWRGRGLATPLVQAAWAHGARVAPRARAAVAADNKASARSFARAGFHQDPEPCTLLICQTKDRTLRPSPTPPLLIREASTPAEAAAWLPHPSLPQEASGLSFLLAEKDSQPAGYAELVQVQTLLYQGVWIESLQATESGIRSALVDRAVNKATSAGLDEIGAMVPDRQWPLRDCLLARGFRSLGHFHWWEVAQE
jgi:ribosomal protein S18 acetylase RimI-like enzyme